MSETIINDQLQNQLIKNLMAEIDLICRNVNESYIDVVVEFCEKHDLDPVVVGKLIRKNVVLHSRIEKEAEDLNIIEKTAKLPL